jgi:hypothetical protein
MFSNTMPLPPPGPDGVREQVPGHAALDRLVQAVAACLRRSPGDPAAAQTAILIWQQLHGVVSLRISRPLFPWPPLAGTVSDAVDRLLAGAQTDDQNKDR